jgi:Uma2 family endonuclease
MARRGQAVGGTVSIMVSLDLDRVWRLSRAQFEQMIDAGLFAEDDRVELLEGVLVEMSPQSDDHANTVVLLTNALARLVGARAAVATHVPFPASDRSRPDPDVALWPPGRRPRDPLPAQPLLVVEVAASRATDDRVVKGPIYARAGVPEYWLVNLAASTVEVYTQPSDVGYLRRIDFSAGDRIRLVAFADVEVAVDDFLP